MPTIPSLVEPKQPIRVACCMPRQEYSIEKKLSWMEKTLDEIKCDLFLTPQEYFGGHYIHCQRNQMPLHIERDWLVETMGEMAARRGICLGVGACVRTKTAGAMEDYLYFDSKGSCLGWHSKFALPSYDDQRTGGHGQLWPETNYKKRITPIQIPELRLNVGTVFCWEVFSQTIWGAYSCARVNLVVHPIKFAPRGWLKNEEQADGFKHIVGFGNAPKSQMWVDRLIMAGRHQVMCPIAVSCNSWNLGPKMLALTGHVDEMKKTADKGSSTQLFDVESIGDNEKVHTFEMVPEFYEGIDHHHSAGAFKAHVGTVEGFSEMGEHTMHGKIRRLESQLIGDTTRMDCMLKSATLTRQKKSTTGRAFGKLQQVRLPKRS